MDNRLSSSEVMSAHGATVQFMLDGLRGGDPAVLSRCVTLMEGGDALAELVHREVYPFTGRAMVVGFTGVPGAGKSTLIDAYICRLRANDKTVAVVAVDPSSPFSGGALLGDRVRMQSHAEDLGVFIRSVASRGHVGGLAENVHRIIDAMDCAGRDVIIVETVGTGQSEVEIVEIADVCVVVNAPNLGDDVQAMKAGVLEIADVLVVNKADLPSADRTTMQLKAMLSLRRDTRSVPLIETVAIEHLGIESLAMAIDSRVDSTGEGRLRRRERRIRRLIAQLAGRRIRDLVTRASGKEMSELVSRVSTGELCLSEAAAQALAMSK